MLGRPLLLRGYRQCPLGSLAPGEVEQREALLKALLIC